MSKLELTWIGKDKQINPEPRILIKKDKLCYGEKSTGNILIHGDNLLALKSLEQEFAGRVKCIYIDPPYNSGSLLEHYEDNLEHSTWLSLMKPRLELLRNLLSNDGTIWIQIDEDEQAYLKVICDEVFGRKNFINMISVNMKNVAGASGGGEDKKLKKNCEFILAYAKDYSIMPLLNGIYNYTEISDLIEEYQNEGKSWKYTTVLLDAGEKHYLGSTFDGEGNDIKVYARKNTVTMSINQIAKCDNISVKDAYKKYGTKVFRTTNSQSSIRTRIIDYRKEQGITESVLSIEYIPKTGKNKGTVYEQFYKDDICNLFVWLSDTSEFIEGELYKKDLLGTYWDMNAWMKNVTKEGGVTFAKSKKPEQLVNQIFSMATQKNDLVLDSFLGSGTTAAVAHKMGRRWIGIELGDHAYTHCKVRLDKVIDGEQGGISKAVDWKGGGGYDFYELAPSLINKSKIGMDIISQEYNAEMLAAAMAKHENYTYCPDETISWKQGYSGESKYKAKNFIFTTTGTVTVEYIDGVALEMKEDEFLLICASSFTTDCKKRHKNIVVQKIPQTLLGRCEYGKTDYNLNVVESLADFEDEEGDNE